MKIAVAITTTACRKMIHDMSDLNRNTLFFLGNEIADAAHGVDLNLGAAIGELFAQTMDINLDGIRGDIVGKPEEMIFNQPLWDDAALAAHQKFEHRRLTGGKHLRLIVNIYLPALGIENEVGNAQRAAEQLAW